MIRTCSLYGRIVLTFMAVVVFSTFVSIVTGILINEQYFTSQYKAELTTKLQQIETHYLATEAMEIPLYLQNMAQILQINLVGLGPNGQRFTIGNRAEKIMSALNEEAGKSAALGRTPFLLQRSSGNGLSRPEVFAVGMVVDLDGQRWLLAIQPQVQIEYFFRALESTLLPMLIVGSLLILVAARYLVKPLKEMTAATGKIAEGHFETRLTLQRRDEIGELADSINRMADNIGKIERMRQEFISNVSHEIQSPLTSITGFAEALKSEQANESERLHYIETIQRETRRLSQLTSNLLRLASLDSEQHPFHPKVYPLHKQLQQAVLTFEPQWSEKRQVLDLELEEVAVFADEDQLMQVWMNLLSNCIKFTEAGGRISIRLACAEGQAVVVFEDNGIGMKEEELARIFERFYKADPSRSRKREGSGLGLAIVKKIVETHKGTVEVRSVPGAGSVFTVRIPAEPREAAGKGR